MPFIAIALIVAAALGGGTSLAAQSALPGDALWGFKVGVNERIAETVAVGEKAKADVDISHAQTRLEEAAKLAAEGRLDASAQAKIQGNFDAHARAVAERVAALQAKGDYAAAADVAVRFQAAVAAHIAGLTNAQARASTNANAKAQTVLSGLINKV